MTQPDDSCIIYLGLISQRAEKESRGGRREEEEERKRMGKMLSTNTRRHR